MRLPVLVLTLIVSLSGMSLLCGEIARIELDNGAEIQGQILAQPEGRIVVDLGYTILDIPRKRVIRIYHPEQDEEIIEETNELFFTLANPVSKPINDLVEEEGPGVVLIRTPIGLGSGFFIHPDGYVITNDHVIAGEHDITITVYHNKAGGMERQTYHNVRIVATSPDKDLALLQILGEEEGAFHALPIGDSNLLRPGQRVFAIGSPLGLERTVSEGIVSIRNRLIQGQLFIQGTAQISPGNSGGPLFNLQGEVIGVNNMKIVGMGAEGLGFAIPSQRLKNFLINRDAFSFDPSNPNSGFRYHSPPSTNNQTEEDED